jgi:hypothetical protein
LNFKTSNAFSLLLNSLIVKIKPVQTNGFTETLDIPNEIAKKPSNPMKTIIVAIVSLAIATTFVHAQGGEISWFSSLAKPQTNNSYYAAFYPPPGVQGETFGSGAGLYYFMLLTATSTTAFDAGNPLGPDWNVLTYQTGGIAYGTNGFVAGSVTGLGTAAGFSSGLTPGISYSDMVVGWSASLGTTWDQILPQVETGNWLTQGYFGYSNVGTITPNAYPAPGASIFGPTGIQSGQTILYYVEPEPATLALLGLGSLSMLLLRRRKP